MRILLLLTAFALISLRASASEEIQVAEYRADVDDVAWSVGVDSGDLYSTKGNLALYSNDPDNEVIGPRLYSTPNSFAQLYYYGLDREDDEYDLYSVYALRGESSSQRTTGLSQTWFFARKRARITLGYEFEQSETDQLYDDLRAHSVIFRSRFPLFWGLSARINADYAHNTYDNYLGFSDIGSDRTLFQASIDQSLGKGLLGELKFSYTDEDFGDSDLSYRRYVWGLNLKYKY
jgi:hypothetical protein